MSEKSLQRQSKNFKNKSLASKYSELFPALAPIIFLCYIFSAKDHSSLVRCVKKNEQQKIIWPNFVKENTVSIGKMAGEKFTKIN